jgi:hypothetical protein
MWIERTGEFLFVSFVFASGNVAAEINAQLRRHINAVLL